MTHAGMQAECLGAACTAQHGLRGGPLNSTHIKLAAWPPLEQTCGEAAGEGSARGGLLTTADRHSTLCADIGTSATAAEKTAAASGWCVSRASSSCSQQGDSGRQDAARGQQRVGA